jgi:DNA-binding transcriptional LysR family regulator
MDIQQVEAFMAVVRHGGFTSASAALHLSQPAISRRVQLLETELGAPLFHRLPGGARPTEAGDAFRPYAETLLAAARDGADAVAELRGVTGTVRLALVGTLAATSLTAQLRRFREAHPAVDLRLRTALSDEVSALVRAGDVTLGLRYGRVREPDLAVRALPDERVVTVCAPNHRLAGTGPVHVRQLTGERWLAFPAHTGETYATVLDRLLTAAGLADAQTVPIDSLTAQKRMAEAGFGLALVPESSIAEETRAGTLAELDIPALRGTLHVSLIHRRDAFIGGATNALIAELTVGATAVGRGGG